MKILIVNTFDNGGAANSCKRLHLGLLSKNIESNVLLKSRQNNWPNSFIYKFKLPAKWSSTSDKIKNKIKRILKELKLYDPKQVHKNENQKFLNRRPKGLEMFSFPNSGIDITQTDSYKEIDIINLHWVANFLDYNSFFEKNIKPVVWTLHDMNPFSGGEHYEEKYLGIDNFGSPIRRQVSEEEKTVAKKNIKIKKQALSKVNNLTIVAPSEWLAEEARKSEVFKNYPVLCIPYGLDAEIYTPRDQDYSRDLLGIPKDKKVVLFVADSISNNRKGFVYLKRALQQLSNKNVVLCAIGQKNSELESMDNILELGPIYDERLMSVAYSAADVFVIPSLMDNLPNTVLESIMCGTPVIGFPVGGIPEMIIDGKNGLLTKEISINSFVETLTDFLDKPERFDKDEIRADALKKYDQKIQAERYISLFKEINGQV
ncbi:glycosyltransferase [Gillisia sp. Q332]|uniref:glycosyltransferase n=1 Tax=Gillisia xinjiangensis TaxID=3384765 RepID=UPI00391B182D